jgi:hypothetical protein
MALGVSCYGYHYFDIQFPSILPIDTIYWYNLILRTYIIMLIVLCIKWNHDWDVVSVCLSVRSHFHLRNHLFVCFQLCLY